MKRRILLFSILLLFSCEEEKVDTVPPEMVVTSPANDETVYEIVTINCTITDDEGVSLSFGFPEIQLRSLIRVIHIALSGTRTTWRMVHIHLS